MCLTLNVTNNKFSGDSWILVPSVTPSDTETSTQSSLDTTFDTKTVSAAPLITLSTLSDNITNEITSGEEAEVESTEKIRETTLVPTSSEEEQEDSSEYVGVTGASAEETAESDEDETTTTSAETETINFNLTSSTALGNNTHFITKQRKVLCSNRLSSPKTINH